MKKTNKKQIIEKEDSTFNQGNLATFLFFITGLIFFSAKNLDELLPPILEALNLPSPDDDTLFGIGLFLLLCVVPLLALLAYSYSFKHRKSNQGLRDSQVNSDADYALYLRTFFSDRMYFRNPVKSVFTSSLYAQEPTHLRPEEFVGRVLEPYINVLQMGGHKDTIGNSTMYTSDSKWQTIISEKVNNASFIIILPGIIEDKKGEIKSGLSTLWELEYLVRNKHINRTIIIMPPYNRGVRLSWENVRKRSREFSLILPPYRLAGAIITLEYNNDLISAQNIFWGSFFNPKRLAVGLVEAMTSLYVIR